MKQFGWFLFLLLCSLWEVQIGTAHPLDVSNTSMSIYETSVMGVTYIHPVELDRILVNDGKVTPMQIGVDTYYSLTGVLVNYLAETIELENNGENCTLGDFSFQEDLMIDEIYSGGFPISYVFHCSSKIRAPIITINFMTEVPLQTNRLYVYRSVDGGEMVRTDYRVLNAQKKSHSLSFAPEEGTTLKDADNDGIIDEDELLYRTDPKNPDTDDDGYTDGVEIHNSWDPLSSFLSPGQRVNDTSLKESQSSLTGQALSAPITLAENTGVWGASLFSKVLYEIRLYVDGEIESKGIWFLLILIGILGFLHALGPGHSKGILISQILDEHMSYRKSILYCTIFTVVHLLDIIIVVLLSKVFFTYLDSSVYLSGIARLSAFFVIVIGAYLFLSSLRRYFMKKDQTHPSNTLKKKNYLFLALITGLAPCAFGWSIFLMLLALGKSSLAFPMLLALGLGIFFCLWMIATITWYSKTKIYAFSPKIGLFSPIISSFFILLIGTGLVLQNF